VERLKADIRKKRIQMPIRAEVSATGRRWKHDGAHRLLVGQELGLEEVPVEFSRQSFFECLPEFMRGRLV
jgi:hypothetical protein